MGWKEGNGLGKK